MEKVPQIVIRRLNVATPAGEHPDADVLTAFSESSLGSEQRSTVLEHLAACAECREIVALALPASEPVQELAPPSKVRWFTWPVLRWGFIAAGIAAVASLGIVQYQRQHAPSTMAYNASPAQPLAKKAENPSERPNASAVDQEQAATPSATLAAKQPSAGSNTPASDLSPGVTAGSGGGVGSGSGGGIGSGNGVNVRALPHGPKLQLQQNVNQQNANNANEVSAGAHPLDQPAPAPPPFAKQKEMASGPAMREAPSAAPSPTLEANARTATVDSPVLENQRIDQQPSQSSYAESKVERIKPAGASIVSPSKVLARDMQPPSTPAGAPVSGSLVSTSPGSPTRWTINSAGGLQRSFDQGGTWQDVDINSSAPATEGMSLVKAPSRTKSATYDTLQKKDAAPLVFRAVAANGPDVWAGASGGLLYHSPDAGAHWTRVVPSASGASLTGDILTVEFIDSQHGRVTTSAPQVWTTADGGQSWQKQ